MDTQLPRSGRALLVHFGNVQTCGKVARTVSERFYLDVPSVSMLPHLRAPRSVCVGARACTCVHLVLPVTCLVVTYYNNVCFEISSVVPVTCFMILFYFLS